MRTAAGGSIGRAADRASDGLRASVRRRLHLGPGQIPLDLTWMSSRLLAVVLTVLAVPAGIEAVAQWGRAPTWWNLVAVTAPLAGLAFAALGEPQRAATVLWVGLTGCMLVLPLVDVQITEEQPWVLLLFTVTAGGTALISHAWWVSGGMLAVLIVSAVVCRASTQPDVDLRVMCIDVVYAVAVWGVAWTVRGALEAAAADVRHERDEAMRAFAHARAAEAEARAAQAWDSYLHDEVIAALAVVSRADPAAAVACARARDIVAGATAVHADEVPSPPLASGTLETVLALLPTADTDLVIAEEPLPLPSSVRRALIEALSEALRNIDRHAHPDGRLGHATVRLRHDEDSVEVRVTDDGVGFDLARVDPSRLGLMISVQGRMDAVGGGARIASRPGLGTSVVLRWPGR